MPEPTISDVDALWGPATPQFALQIAARVATLIEGLEPDNPVRAHGELRLRELQQLGLGTTKGEASAH